MLTCGFFNSVNGDRKYNARNMTEYFEGLFSSGVVGNPADSFQVKALSTPAMAVRVLAGKAFINGYWAKNDGDFRLNIEAANVAVPRIDAIVLRLDLSTSGRNISLQVIKGTASSTPTAPAITRSDTIKDYLLATVYVGAGATSINNGDITDKRATEDCGYVIVVGSDGDPAVIDTIANGMYIATGTNDNLALSNFIQAFLNGGNDYKQLELDVYGELGITYPASTGSSTVTWFAFNATNKSTRRVKLNFANTTRINITAQSNIKNVMFDCTNGNVEIDNLQAVLNSCPNGSIFSGTSNPTVTDSAFWLNGTGSETLIGAYQGTFLNCRMSVTNGSGAAYGFSGNGNVLRLTNVEVLAYNTTGSSNESVAVHVMANQTNNILLMTNCTCPVSARNGYKQNNVVKVNSGYFSLVGNTLGKEAALYSSGAGKSEIGTIYYNGGGRSDTDGLNHKINAINDDFVPFELIKNSYVDYLTGEFKYDDEWVRTDYNKIPSFGLYVGMDDGVGPNGYVALYDANKEYTGTFYINKGSISKVGIDNKAVYVVFSGPPAAVDSMKMISESGAHLVIDKFGYNKSFDSYFIHATTDANGEIVRGNSGHFVTENILYSPTKTFIGIKPSAPINIYVIIYNRLGMNFVSETLVLPGNSYTVNPDTPFRVLIRKNDGSRMEYSYLDYLIFEYTPYQKEAKLYFAGQTPVTFPHENDTTSGYFNMIETPDGHIIVEDASHASNNAFIADFIDKSHKKFDFFIVSHWHDDHVGLLGEFIRLGRIDSNTVVFLPEPLRSDFTSVFPDDGAAYSAYQRYTEALTNAGVTIIYPTENSKYLIGGVVITFWNTEHDKYYELEATAKNYNDLSLCFYAEIGNIRVGYPGDLGPIGQDQCKDSILNCHIYNAQHHGWDNGVNNLIHDYIEKLSPNVVVADDGAAHNVYFEQPGSPMVTWCLENCVPFYRCYPQCDGFVEMIVKDGTYKFNKPTQRYKRSNS